MDEDNKVELVFNMRKNRGKLDNDGHYWSDEDKTRLKNLFNAVVDLTDISLSLGRTERAVMHQINKQSLYSPRQEGSRYQNRKVYDCRCRTCKVSPENCPNHLSFEQRGH